MFDAGLTQCQLLLYGPSSGVLSFLDSMLLRVAGWKRHRSVRNNSLLKQSKSDPERIGFATS